MGKWCLAIFFGSTDKINHMVEDNNSYHKKDKHIFNGGRISIYKRKYNLPIINVQPKLPYGFIW